ncbi:ABC transporter substrate-binding protein [Halosimplex aquaticum]
MYGYDGGFDKEAFYEIDADIHLIDPNTITTADDAWDGSDVAEIESNVGALFGKSNGRDRGWNSEYLVPMYDLLERYARVFDERDRYDELAAVHEEVQSAVASRLPPESERPSVGVLLGGSDPAAGTFYLSRITEAGSRHKHYRDLAIDDAFADLDFGGETFIEGDYETLLEVDPDVLLFDNHLPGVSRSLAIEGTETWRTDHVAEMKRNAAGSDLTAVSAGRVYPAGMGEQGPITNLFNTEALGKQLYPEQFPEDERLFDRQRIVDIVNGDL